MTAAAQDIILRAYNFTAPGVVNVQVTRRTRPLLKLAGINRARLHDNVEVRVERNAYGQLTVVPPVAGA